MSSNSGLVCKFNMTGHCKYGNQCRNFHITKTCTKYPCLDEGCKTTSRHPKPCRFFSHQGKCKFKSNCSFLHISVKNFDVEIEALKNEVNSLKVKNIELNNQILKLDKLVENLMRIQSNESHSTETVLYACEKCEFKCENEGNLEHHMQTLHINASRQEHNSKFECDKCDYESTTQKGVNIHKGTKHKEKAEKDVDQEDPKDNSNPKDEIIESKLEAYCPECDILFRCHELLMYRNHCRIVHGWFCCENINKSEGCDFTATTNEDLHEHRTHSCDYI